MNPRERCDSAIVKRYVACCEWTPNEKECLIRNLLLAGTAGVILSLGVASDAAHATDPNVPSYSPYAIMGPGDASPTLVQAVGSGMTNEGRAAYVDGAPAYGDFHGMQYANPEDRNYFSRGR